MSEPTAENDGTEVTFIVGDKWPTPTSIRRVADALDAITPARYGDILRAFADAEDSRFAVHGPVEAIRRRVRLSSAGGDGRG